MGGVQAAEPGLGAAAGDVCGSGWAATLRVCRLQPYVFRLQFYVFRL